MKKNILIFVSLLAICSNTALASTDYYISPQLGVSFPNKKLKFEPVNRSASEPEVTKESFKKSVAYGLIFGKKIYDNSFIELEAIHAPSYKFGKTANIDSASGTTVNYFKTKLQTSSIFVNANYQFNDIAPMSLVPYVTAGLGYSSNKIKDLGEYQGSDLHFKIKGKRTSNFAWQVGAGMLIPIADSMDVNLGYKFRSLGNAKSTGRYIGADGTPFSVPAPVLKGKIYTSDVMLGVSFKF